MSLTYDHQNPFVHIYFLLSITSHKASEKDFCARRIKQQGGGRHDENDTSLGFSFYYIWWGCKNFLTAIKRISKLQLSTKPQFKSRFLTANDDNYLVWMKHHFSSQCSFPPFLKNYDPEGKAAHLFFFVLQTPSDRLGLNLSETLTVIYSGQRWSKKH